MSPHDAPLGARGRTPRREAGNQVLVFDAFLSPGRDALDALERCGFVVILCHEVRGLLEEMVQRPPAAVVFGLRPERSEDLGMLHLVRRVLPRVPLILLAGCESLEVQRLVQDLRPTYYAVGPLDPDELCEAVSAAVARSRRSPSS